MIFQLGELFSGPGGLALGATHAHVTKGGEDYRIEHVWANDMDEAACATYEANIPSSRGSRVIPMPVQNLEIGKLAPIDAFAFGFPCNDYSLVGEQRGLAGNYGPLYTYGRQVLDFHKPKWFLAENVGGLRNNDDGRAFDEITNSLRSAGQGYRLTVHLFRFEQYGVPQQRHRIIIVGIDRSLGLEFRVPAPTTPDRPRTAREALEEPPIPEGADNQEPTRQSPAVVERLRHIPPGQNAWYDQLPQEYRLNVKGAKLSQIYRRLDPDKPSYTVTGSGGGGTHGYHWEELRALTNRERARLQTFPDDFRFHGSKEAVRKQIGMAVPPHGAQIIFEAILKTFAGVEYESVAPRWPECGNARVDGNVIVDGNAPLIESKRTA